MIKNLVKMALTDVVKTREDFKGISDFCRWFYSDLYKTSSDSDQAFLSFLASGLLFGFAMVGGCSTRLISGGCEKERVEQDYHESLYHFVEKEVDLNHNGKLDLEEEVGICRFLGWDDNLTRYHFYGHNPFSTRDLERVRDCYKQ